MNHAAGAAQPLTRRCSRRVRHVGSNLEHAQHDRADNGECDIRGHHAQSPDEWTAEDHWETSLVDVAARINNRNGDRFRAEKASPAVFSAFSIPAEPSVAWLKNREINALKSP